jgi:branched-chain amino acid transport system substrate-binding protein
MIFRRDRLIAFAAVSALALAACGGSDTGTATTDAAAPPASEVAVDSAAPTEATTADTEVTEETTADTEVTEETEAAAAEGWTVSTDDCVDPEAANAPITGTLKIGSAMPLSGGPAAAAFAPVADGYKAYIEYANAQGLTGDLKLEVEIADDQYSKDLTPGAVNGLLDNGAHIISGVIGSPNNAAIRDTLNEECVPQLLALTGSPAWGEVADYPWTTGALIPYNIESQAYAAQIKELMPDGATVGLFYVNNEFGQIYADAFKELAVDGIELVEEQTIEATDENPPTAQANAIAAQKPDVIMAIPLGAGCPKFLSEIANAKAANPGWEPKIFLTATCASALILAISGAAGDGLYTSANLKDVGNPATHGEPGVKEYVDYMTSLGKPDIIPTAGAGWTAAEITVAIIMQAQAGGDVTRASIMNAARNFTYTPSLARDGVVEKMNGEEDGYMAESLQVLQWDFDTKTFTDVGDLITDFES